MLVLIIILIIVIVLSLLFIFGIFSKKCVTYSDTKTGAKGGGCFYIWQKGYWHAYPELFGPEIVETKTLAEYGKIVKYSLNEAIEFPDFTLKYKGVTKTPGPNNAKWSITNYNFEIMGENWKRDISWSSGMGDIGPTIFEVSNKRFMFEKAYASKLKENLKDNEVVVTQDGYVLMP